MTTRKNLTIPRHWLSLVIVDSVVCFHSEYDDCLASLLLCRDSRIKIDLITTMILNVYHSKDSMNKQII
jgi:inosine-uridine nucleoside N-ribohydrolase